MKKYSIILPVRNGGEYVKECINSILAQSLDDFNLVVLDNCSTDGTTQWIQSLKDERIYLYESKRPLTIEENWGRIVSVQKNKFITLIGHDDLLAPNYLSVMENLILQYPEASLYQAHFNFIDNKGIEIRKSKSIDEVQSPEEFLANMLQNKIDLLGTGFMMRSKDYDAIGGIPDYPNLLFADFELWINLARLKHVAVAKEECFSFRIHQSTTSRSPDVKMHKAFEHLMYFLESLKKENRNLDKVIKEYAVNFIAAYCKGLSHRLLRTPIEKRDHLSVKIFLQKCKQYADMLVPGNDFDPRKNFSISLAEALDSTAFGRYIFLMFKKIYGKPVLK
jgi:glycosyltransferase involved in cell wall biosynthesis